MKVISRDEIRIDSVRVKVVIRCVDEWNREIVNSFVVTRPLREWKSPRELTPAGAIVNGALGWLNITENGQEESSGKIQNYSTSQG